MTVVRQSRDITGNSVAYGHKPTIAGQARTGEKCSSLVSRDFVSPEVMVGLCRHQRNECEIEA